MISRGEAVNALRVVHIDDDPVDHALVGRTLGRTGTCSVQHVASFGELEQLLLEQMPPDVVLLNPSVGHYRGLEALHQLLDLSLGVPILVIVDAPGGLGEEAIALGAEDYLTKAQLDPSLIWSTMVRAHLRWRTRTPGLPSRRIPGTHGRQLELQPGAIVDRYTVEAVVGRGGMAMVYRVRHRILDSVHALKVVHPHMGIEAKRLRLEGQVQSHLRHPHVVVITDAVTIGTSGTVGLVMEYVDGPSLKAWLASDERRGALWLDLFRGILRGVRSAHRLGVVHRDLKPDNVLLHRREGRWIPKVTDFGIAKNIGEGAPRPRGPRLGTPRVWSPTGPGRWPDATMAGTAMGTLGYMAPEQAVDASSADVRSDVYSLGCLLYTMVCGRKPFVGSDGLAVLRNVMEGDYPPPSALVPGLDPAIEDLLGRMLCPDPEARLQDCQDVLEALDPVDPRALVDRAPYTGG